jgi:hypothetical protein
VFPTEQDKANMIKACYPDDGMPWHIKFAPQHLASDPEIEQLKRDVKAKLEEFKKPNTFEPYKAVIETPMGEPSIVVDWRLVELARELCRSAGHDPDLRILDVKNANRGPLGSTIPSLPVPAWTLFVEAAKNVMGALNG